MVLYALAGRAIYRGQIKNQRMKYALSDFHPRRSPTPTPGPIPTRLGSVTKCTSISQTSEVLPPAPVDAAHVSQILHDEPKGSAESITLAGGESRSSFSSESRPATRAAAAPAAPEHYRASSFDTHTTRVAAPVDPGAHTRVTTTVEATNGGGPTVTLPPRRGGTPGPGMARHHHRATESQTNRGARTYALVAFSLYVVMLVTWVPSTANRVYGVVHADALNFGLNALAATVLPLQGFFNTCVYMFISRGELWRKFNELRGKRPAGSDAGSRKGSVVTEAPVRRESRASMIMRTASPPVGGSEFEGMEAVVVKGHLPLHHWPLRGLTNSKLFENAVSEFV